MAVGIGVTDLARSAEFYQRALGMKQTQIINLEHLDEIVLVHEGRNAIVLMNWKDGVQRNYRDNPVKLVFQVEDAGRLIERIRSEGLTITMEPAPYPGMGGAIIGMGLDPDGYAIELIQAAPAMATAG
jgi:predicted enzyme related to lactoylglutathione lyase